METLAEALGLVVTRENGTDIQTVALDSKALADMPVEEFCRTVLQSAEYRLSILERVSRGALAPAVETRLMDYAWGKPVERVEHKIERKPAAELSNHELAAELEQVLLEIRKRDAIDAESSSSSDTRH